MNNQNNKDNKRHGVEEVVPVLAYEKLTDCNRSFLVDVRTRAEWSFVGTPVCQSMKNDVIFCEWASFPDMVKKSEFLENLLSHLNLEKSDNIFFICRSGARSFQAAIELSNFLGESGKAFSGISCFNVKYGFEGGLSDDAKRGGVNGWKFSNLPWQQL